MIIIIMNKKNKKRKTKKKSTYLSLYQLQMTEKRKYIERLKFEFSFCGNTNKNCQLQGFWN